jgi:hypothetical protein
MPEEQKQPEKPAAEKKKPAAPPPDAGHVPMGEEFDRAKWTLPPWQPVAIALAIVAVVVLIVVWQLSLKPLAVGSIDDVTAVQLPGDNVLVAVQVTVTNPGRKALWIHNLKGRLKTAKGEFSDDAASPVDFERYFQGFPDLGQHAIEPLKVETKIAPGATERGMIIVSFPVNKETFDKRQAISVIIEPYDQRAVVITKQ